MSLLEDRLLEHESEHSNPYEKLRKLQMRRDQHKKMQRNKIKKQDTAVSEVEQPQVLSKQASKKVAKQVPKMKSKFSWGNSKDGDVDITPKEKKEHIHIKPVQVKSTDKILSFLGYKIDINAKVDEFKERYQKAFIESRSHNFLLAKFSELKSGAFHFILGLCGIPTEELKLLQREALKSAKEENMKLYEQNIYNIELFTLFSNSKKDRGKLKVFNELEKQLIVKMARLGESDFYSDAYKNDIQQKSVRVILQKIYFRKSRV